MQPSTPAPSQPESQPPNSKLDSLPIPEMGTAPANGEKTSQGFSPAATPAAPSATPTDPATTTSSSTAAPNSTAPPSTTPTTAADVDLIEKPWVEQAERIIDEKKGDPKAEDSAEQALNKQYLKQRFNFDVDNPE